MLDYEFLREFINEFKTCLRNLKNFKTVKVIKDLKNSGDFTSIGFMLIFVKDFMFTLIFLVNFRFSVEFIIRLLYIFIFLCLFYYKTFIFFITVF